MSVSKDSVADRLGRAASGSRPLVGPDQFQPVSAADGDVCPPAEREDSGGKFRRRFEIQIAGLLSSRLSMR